MGKIEKVEKSKMVENEYEIRTDLPLARAHPRELDEDKLATLRHTFFACLFFNHVVVGSSSWGFGAPQSGLPS